MATTASPGELSLSQFKETLAAATGDPFTGDASLDLLLHVMSPDIRRGVEALAIPHWFGAPGIERVARSQDVDGSALQDMLLRMPFVRTHERGLSYHEEARRRIRTALLSRDPERARTICRDLAPAYPAPEGDPSPADAERWAEHLYLRLPSDEVPTTDTMAELVGRLRGHRASWAVNLLVSMLGEQLPLLSPRAHSFHKYLSGLAAFDRMAYATATEQLAAVDLAHMSTRDRLHVQLYLGWILEETGESRLAVRRYREALRDAEGTEGQQKMKARLHLRCAEASLARGRLGDAEKSVRKSIEINVDAGDLFGVALNRAVLGRIYRHLGDTGRAEAELQQTLGLLREAGRAYHASEVLMSLGQIRRDVHAYAEAEAALKETVQMKVELGDHHGLAFAYSELGKLELMRQDRARALKWYQSSLDLLRQFGDSRRVAAVLTNIAVIHAGSNDFDRAIQRIDEALALLPPEHSAREQSSRRRARWAREQRRLELPWARRNAGGLVGAGLIVLILLAAAVQLIRVNGNFERLIVDRLAEVRAGLITSPGDEVVLERLGRLNNRDAESHRFLLEPGVYEIRTVCDDDCGDMDLTLTNISSDMIEAEDAAVDRLASLHYEASLREFHALRVTMYACSNNPCYYGAVVVRKGGAQAKTLLRDLF